ncbi:MAG: beta-1,6-N-acetylglucosaminyltransferase [Pseudomonadota bacterium]
MNVGFVMLCHTALHRAAQVARYWAEHGCPVVIHVDRRVAAATYTAFADGLANVPNIRFSRRLRCEWGSWSLVAATQTAVNVLLTDFPRLRHVYYASGSCLPLRPVNELKRYLDRRPHTDFIESVATEEVPWTVGGLDRERFIYRFPFSWKRRRFLFDQAVKIQRLLRIKRKIPGKIVPHLGSQWWCLTRRTLSAILEDPNRPIYDNYFKRVWIPDESYFQTLARLHSAEIESRSLTLSKFDFQGKPHIFYDDHLQLLRRSDCFVARKIWPHAERLYEAFLSDDRLSAIEAEPNPEKIDRVFAQAVERRTRGRPGLIMQSRFPHEGWENGKTAGPYSVFEGFNDVFADFEHWLTRRTGNRVHGNLFHPRRVQFAGNETIFNGSISDSPALRDYDPRGFLSNLIWNTRGERQCFQFGPGDSQGVTWFMATDSNAQISVVTGAWALSLFHSDRDFSDIRAEAARLQRIERKHLEILRSSYTKARVRIWTLADFVLDPMHHLQTIVDEIAPSSPRRPAEAPVMVDMKGFGRFLQNLKNQGMKPVLMGDFPAEPDLAPSDGMARKSYLAR